jgi:two-component system chemotaxis response regulator CheB
VTPLRVLLVGCDAPLERRVRAALAGTADLTVAGAAPLEGRPMAAVQSLAPAVVLLDAAPAADLPADLLAALLAVDGLALVTLLRPDHRPFPGALVRGLGEGRLELIRPPVEAPTDAAERWDRALADVLRAIARRPSVPRPPSPGSALLGPRHRPPRMIGIAASTGGPPALSQILGELPADLPVPLLLAQHITPGFVGGLVRWLSGITPLALVVAEPGTAPLPGHVYLAPDGCDLALAADLRLTVHSSGDLHSPSADRMFLSMAQELGAEAAGVVLTGMGSDGAHGMAAIHQAGGTTLAQDEGSSVVFGMPKAAIEAGAAGEVLALADIARAIRAMAGARRTSTPPSTAGAMLPMRPRR